MRALSLLSAATLIACAQPQQEPGSDTTPAAAPQPVSASAQQSITDRDWSLVTLGSNANPVGNGNRAPTLTLDSSSNRASGFAGCNRFTGSYTLNGDSLSFGAMAVTKMACAQGNEVEVAYLQALSQVRLFSLMDSVLTLRADAGGDVVATFR